MIGSGSKLTLAATKFVVRESRRDFGFGKKGKNPKKLEFLMKQLLMSSSVLSGCFCAEFGAEQTVLQLKILVKSSTFREVGGIARRLYLRFTPRVGKIFQIISLFLS